MFTKNGVILDSNASPGKKDDSCKVAQWKQNLIKDYGLKPTMEGPLGKRVVVIPGRRMLFVWAEHRIKDDPENPHRPITPAGFGIQWEATIQTDKGPEAWRYYERENQLEGGGSSFIPKRETFRGILSLGINDIDKILFLMYFCPSVLQSKNASSSMMNIYIELKDDAKKATDEIFEEKKIIYIKQKVYNNFVDGGLEINHVRKVAKALFVRNVDVITIDMVRTEIIKVANKDDESLVTVYDMLKSNDEREIEIRSTIQTAAEKKYIGVMDKPSKRMWYFMSQDGEYTDFICNVSARNTDEKESLVAHYQDVRPEDFQDLKDILADNA